MFISRSIKDVKRNTLMFSNTNFNRLRELVSMSKNIFKQLYGKLIIIIV